MITISPKQVARRLTFVTVALTIGSLAGSFSTYVLGSRKFSSLVWLFSVDREANIPTWYASMLLLACAILLALIVQVKRHESAPFVRSWRLLAIVFLFLSFDEFAGIHERLIPPLRAALQTNGIFYFAWVIPYSLLFVVLGLSYLRFFFALPLPIRRLFAIAAMLYVGGALGMEMVDGAYASVFGQENFGYACLTTLEELGEMLGVVMFIYALLSYLKSEGREIVFASGQPQSQ